MSTPSILVSGASIAGPTVASWLAATGWDVTSVGEGAVISTRSAARAGTSPPTSGRGQPVDDAAGAAGTPTS
jgi:2-polyprenyl-6-methoxyphenol hydroxylase-like FAD-dependent oxidoreductase